MKVKCPRHEDINPSCEVYPEHGYCFVCSEVIPLSELGIKGPYRPEKEPYVENVNQKLDYIRLLGRESIRGLWLPCDSTGYYICWPNANYYKLRLHNPRDGESKYLGPTGHKPPIFKAREFPYSRILYIVEGEINALSLAETDIKGHIISLGSASNFISDLYKKELTPDMPYDNIVVVVDKDPAGIAGAISIKSKLLAWGKKVSVVLMSIDANEMLLTVGKEALQHHVENNQV